jgi:hypothetical protein
MKFTCFLCFIYTLVLLENHTQKPLFFLNKFRQKNKLFILIANIFLEIANNNMTSNQQPETTLMLGHNERLCPCCNLIKNKKYFQKWVTIDAHFFDGEHRPPWCKECLPKAQELYRENLIRHQRVIRPTSSFFDISDRTKSRDVIKRQLGKEKLHWRLKDHSHQFAVRIKGSKGKAHCNQCFLVSFPYINPGEEDRGQSPRSFEGRALDLEEYREQVEDLDLAFHYEKYSFREKDAWLIIIAGPNVPSLEECITFIKSKTFYFSNDI